MAPFNFIDVWSNKTSFPFTPNRMQKSFAPFALAPPHPDLLLHFAEEKENAGAVFKVQGFNAKLLPRLSFVRQITNVSINAKPAPDQCNVFSMLFRVVLKSAGFW